MIERQEYKNRVIIEGVSPEIDGGRSLVKRIIGDKVVVEADIFADGHDVLSAALLYRKESNRKWIEVPMEFLANDRWRGSFVVSELGRYRYTLIACLLLLTSSCVASNEVKVRLGEEFSLKSGQIAVISGYNLKIEFVEVTEDSWCPKGVTCIWAGQVVTKVLVSVGDAVDEFLHTHLIQHMELDHHKISW